MYVKDVHISAQDDSLNHGGGGGVKRLTRGPKRKISIFLFSQTLKHIVKFEMQNSKESSFIAEGTCHLFNKYMVLHGAQEEGPKGQNGHFKTSSPLDVEVVQPNNIVY